MHAAGDRRHGVILMHHRVLLCARGSIIDALVDGVSGPLSLGASGPSSRKCAFGFHGPKNRSRMTGNEATDAQSPDSIVGSPKIDSQKTKNGWTRSKYSTGERTLHEMQNSGEVIIVCRAFLKYLVTNYFFNVAFNLYVIGRCANLSLILIYILVCFVDRCHKVYNRAPLLIIKINNQFYWL